VSVRRPPDFHITVVEAPVDRLPCRLPNDALAHACVISTRDRTMVASVFFVALNKKECGRCTSAICTWISGSTPNSVVHDWSGRVASAARSAKCESRAAAQGYGIMEQSALQALPTVLVQAGNPDEQI